MAVCVQPVLCHNDCQEGNLFALEGTSGYEPSGIVDFAKAVAADPLFDIAACHSYSGLGAARRLRRLASGYGLPWDAVTAETCDLYVLDHRVSLWDWCAGEGNPVRAARLAAEIHGSLATRMR